MPDLSELTQLKSRIAQVYAQREAMKRALESGTVPPRAGLDQLETIDRALSGLDARYKVLWDAAHPRVQIERNSHELP